jgi:hypothetical protein
MSDTRNKKQEEARKKISNREQQAAAHVCRAAPNKTAHFELAVPLTVSSRIDPT